MERSALIELLYSRGALTDGHYALEDGRHSSLLFRPARIIQYAPHNRRLCFQIVRHFLELDIHVVIAPTIGSIPVAVEVGRQLEARAVFLEEIDGAMQLSRGFQLHDGERAIVVMDLLKNDDELRPAVQQLRRADARLIGIGGIFDIRESDRAFNVKNVATIRMHDHCHLPADCPRCIAGTPLTSVDRDGSAGAGS
jgi:orotate phosphoribosyltransferase